MQVNEGSQEDKLHEEMLEQLQSPDSLRCHSVQLTTGKDNKNINFGDDNKINYTEEKIKLTHPTKKQLTEDDKEKLLLPDGSARKGSKGAENSMDVTLTPIKIPIPALQTSIQEVDEGSHNSLKFTSVSVEKEGDQLTVQMPKSADKSASIIELKTGSTTQAAKEQQKPQETEDDDPYGLGTKSKQPAAYSPKELEAYQSKLLGEFQHEFKDSISVVENLPRGSIMLSAIKACLADENKLVKRGILDMINNMLR